MKYPSLKARYRSFDRQRSAGNCDERGYIIIRVGVLHFQTFQTLVHGAMSFPPENVKCDALETRTRFVRS